MSKILQYCLYNSGLCNCVMSLEIAVGLAFSTGRFLSLYNVNPVIGGGYGGQVQAKRMGLVSPINPNVLDLFEIPLDLIFQDYFLDVFDDPVSLSCGAFGSNMNSDFLKNRSIVVEPKNSVWHLHSSNLCYYSRFFGDLNKNLIDFIDKVRPKPPYRDFANKIVRSLGEFNGVHVRLTDFDRNPERIPKPIDMFSDLDCAFDNNLKLVVSTDASSDSFFDGYKDRCLFIDEYILENYGDGFRDLPFSDEVVLGLISNMVMWHCVDFVGTPGSTFTGLIHRNWYKLRKSKGLPAVFKYTCSGSNVVLDKMSFREKGGSYSWNSVDIGVDSNMESWFREWPECWRA